MGRITLAVVCTLFCSSLLAAPHKRVAIQNWSVPPLHAVANGAISGRASFIALDPCRVVDTRLANGPYGGPKLVGGASRTFNVPGGSCTGIPTSAAAYSLNFTVLNGEGSSGFLTAYPTGSTRPTVSTLNYGIGNLVANAAIVPAGTSASIDVYVNYNVDVIIDINGYFTEPVITGVTAGTGISVTGTNDVTVGIDTTGALRGQALLYNGTTTTWSNVINGVTAGTGLTGGGTSGTVTLNVAFAGSGSANTAARSDHSHYARTVIVNSGGSATANGTALLNALAGITTASATNPYLLKIEPGIYDLGTASLTMKQFVDIEGSGELTTIVKSRLSSTIGPNATIIGADNAEVRFLTADCSGVGTGNYSTAFYSVNASPSLLHATFKGSSGLANNYGVYVSGGSPKLTFVTATASGGSAALGLIVTDSSTGIVTNSSSSATGASSLNFAISTGNNSSVRFTNVTGNAQGGSNYAAGVYTFNGGVRLIGVVATATGATSNYGLYAESNTGSYTVQVDRSRLVGSTATVRNFTNFTTLIGASQLEGGAVLPNGGTVTCIASYNGNYANAGGFTACP